MLSEKISGDTEVDEEKIIAALRVLSNLRVEAPGDKFIITIEDSHGDLVGVILLSGASDKMIKSKGTINLLEIYGNLASIALNNVRQFERVNSARSEVETLNDLMTHDINNFVQGILGYLDIISSDPKGDPSHREYAKRAIEQVVSTKRLIENVRKLAWIRTGTAGKVTTYDLGTVIGEALNYVKESYPKKEINFISTIGTGEYLISGDEMIQELFINLFSNSVKYTPSNDVPLEFAIKTVQEFGKEFWRIEIIDHGRGIPEEKKQFVFEKFGRQDYTPYGFGLGLSIVRNLVKKYGGRVWVENRIPDDYRKGSKFIVLLPKIEPAPPEDLAADELKKKVVRKVVRPPVQPTKAQQAKAPTPSSGSAPKRP
jgi:signal transduction histidine kinase